MEIEEFFAMSEDEQKEFQERNRQKLEQTKRKLKEQKAQSRRWIEHGKILEDFIPNADKMSNDELIQKLWELIYK